MGYVEESCVESGFIVDLSSLTKTSEMIYELSRILDIPEAQGKNIFLKFGTQDLTSQQLVSIKALVESMESKIEFIMTTSEVTKMVAEELGITVDEVSTTVEDATLLEPEVVEEIEVNPELEKALDKIFGDNSEKDMTEDFKTVEEAQTIENEELIKELERELAEYQEKAKETEKLTTLYIQRNIRSGQSIKSEGNMVIVGDVNPGAEIIAKGDITVWGILGGIAHAGCDGDVYSKIRALKMNAIQIRIADVFARRPDSVNVPFVQKSSSFTPEEARVFRKQVIIHKISESKQ